jgi:hypothetical protein
VSVMDSFEVEDLGALVDVLAPFTRSVDDAHQAAEAVATAISSGQVGVRMEEGYDSCAGCGGYHSVHYDCG